MTSIPDRIRSLIRHHDPDQLWYQLNEIVEQRTYLRHGIELGEGDIVIDVGANVGVAAAFFALDCEVAVVHSFEPVEPIFDLLKRNIRELSACTPHMYGISSHAHRTPITYYPAADAMSGLHADPERDGASTATVMRNLGVEPSDMEEELARRFERVELSCELRTLSGAIESLGLERVDLLKVDVERAEADVLAGIEERDWPRIRQTVIEVHDEDGRLDAISSMLSRHGFSVAVDRDDAMSGTDVHLVYATRQGS